MPQPPYPFMRARTSLLSLPIELICNILAYLETPHLIQCTLVAKYLHHIINTSSHLQYILELSKHRCVNILPSTAHPPYAHRLRLLRARERAWRTLTFRDRHELKLPPTGSVYEFVGGLYGNGREDDSRVTASISFLQLPTAGYDDDGSKKAPRLKPRKTEDQEDGDEVELKRWTHNMGDVTIIDFTMDPSQDLLVLVALAPPQTKHIYQLHLRTISTNEPHPRAPTPILPSLSKPGTPPAPAEIIAAVRVQVAGDLVALLIKEVVDSPGAHLEIWNWEKGDGASVSMTRNTGIDDFTFLSHSQFLLVRPSGKFEVYKFDDPGLCVPSATTPSSPFSIIASTSTDSRANVSPPKPRHKHVHAILQASYLFPQLAEGYMYWYISMSSNPAPGYVPKVKEAAVTPEEDGCESGDRDVRAAEGDNGKQVYYPSPSERIHACCLYVFNPSAEDDHQVHSFVFFLNINTLLNPPKEWTKLKPTTSVAPKWVSRRTPVAVPFSAPSPPPAQVPPSELLAGGGNFDEEEREKEKKKIEWERRKAEWNQLAGPNPLEPAPVKAGQSEPIWASSLNGASLSSDKEPEVTRRGMVRFGYDQPGSAAAALESEAEDRASLWGLKWTLGSASSSSATVTRNVATLGSASSSSATVTRNIATSGSTSSSSPSAPRNISSWASNVEASTSTCTTSTTTTPSVLTPRVSPSSAGLLGHLSSGDIPSDSSVSVYTNPSRRGKSPLTDIVADSAFGRRNLHADADERPRRTPPVMDIDNDEGERTTDIISSRLGLSKGKQKNVSPETSTWGSSGLTLPPLEPNTSMAVAATRSARWGSTPSGSLWGSLRNSGASSPSAAAGPSSSNSGAGVPIWSPRPVASSSSTAVTAARVENHHMLNLRPVTGMSPSPSRRPSAPSAVFGATSVLGGSTSSSTLALGTSSGRPSSGPFPLLTSSPGVSVLSSTAFAGQSSSSTAALESISPQAKYPPFSSLSPVQGSYNGSQTNPGSSSSSVAATSGTSRSSSSSPASTVSPLLFAPPPPLILPQTGTPPVNSRGTRESPPTTSTAIPIPWEVWGPQSTRWFEEHLNTDWQHAIYGLRTVESVSVREREKEIRQMGNEQRMKYFKERKETAQGSEESTEKIGREQEAATQPLTAEEAENTFINTPRFLRIRDFNPYSLTHGWELDSPAPPTKSFFDKGKGKAVGNALAPSGPPNPSKPSTLPTFGAPRIVTEPSITAGKGVFKKDIESWLAYTEVVSEEAFEVTDVMMDDCRLLLLKRGSQGKLQRVDVLTL